MKFISAAIVAAAICVASSANADELPRLCGDLIDDKNGVVYFPTPDRDCKKEEGTPFSRIFLKECDAPEKVKKAASMQGLAIMRYAYVNRHGEDVSVTPCETIKPPM